MQLCPVMTEDMGEVYLPHYTTQILGDGDPLGAIIAAQIRKTGWTIGQSYNFAALTAHLGGNDGSKMQPGSTNTTHKLPLLGAGPS